MNLQAIVFDFDGVIANTEPVHLRAFQAELETIGLPLTEQEYLDHYLGYTDREGFAAVAAAHGRTLDDGEIDGLIARKTVRVQQAFAREPLIYPGVAERIREWAGRVPVAVASGALRAEILTILAREGLVSQFGTVVSADDPVASKPSPQPYLLALERLSNGGAAFEPGRTVAIEDSLWGIASAKAAGMRVVAVTTSYSAEALAGADLVVPGVHALALGALQQVVSVR